ncbi:MAG: DUF4430 domain-containing protein [Dehalococcoidales bacterium]|nr:DUF4430 domain-containing protein [Dehalococcoidales bacterium]
MEVKRFYCIAVLFSLMAVLSGCAQPSFPVDTNDPSDFHEVAAIRLIVGTDYGREVLFNEEVTVRKGETCLDILADKLDVGTAYGGGFITSIEGIKSGYLKYPVERKDWFLYVNGFLSNTGGLTYQVSDGDTVHWYYRDWSFRQSVSAITGSFPGAFKYGYGGNNVATTIWHESGWKEEASRLQQALFAQGVQTVLIRSSDEISQDEKQNHHLIIIGSFQFPPVLEINRNWDRLGMFCRFNNGILEGYSPQGELAWEKSSDAGIIISMQNPFNPLGTGACRNICWVVSGTDKDSIEMSLNTLCHNHQSFEYYTGALITPGELLPLP